MILPNQLTVLRIALTPAFIVFLLFGNGPYNLIIASGIFAIAALTDLYDGMIARKYGTVSRWGAFVDPLADKILLSTAFFGLVMLGYLKLWMVLAVIFRDAVITGVRAYGLRKNKHIKTEKFAKWKTTFQISLISLILIYENLIHNPFGKSLKIEYQNIVDQSGIFYAAMLFIVFITMYSGISYLIGNRRFVKQMAVRIYRTILNSQ
ncbi:MAG: CDP-diacylglycerol--glycerol-3-phosphate 3-phosphatidyltransferase [Candidatus Marinimicrobia bacterium]|nr:CDP-diacylglycerol--glycerol-3-phosphate 3-phosphatidyltransferase [Candidatus Neomarinimicrobiota bacterium]